MLVAIIKREKAPKLDRCSYMCGQYITILDGVAKGNLIVKVIFEQTTEGSQGEAMRISWG